MRNYFQVRLFLIVIAVSFSAFSVAQPAPENDDNLPTDYLSKDFHAGRRAALREIMPNNSVMVVLAYPERTFSEDITYFYHQNPDMYYFTGYKEPHSLLLVFKENQISSSGESFNEILFVQERNPQREQWDGRRLGTDGVNEKLGFKTVMNGKDFKDFVIDFSKFDKIILSQLPADVKKNRYEKADLFSLIQQFKEKSAMPEQMTKQNKFDYRLYQDLTAQLREIKTPEEINLLRKAIEISCYGQNEVMKTVRPDMSELEIQGLHEYVHKRYGAEGVGYGSIIGS
ncbi:MAG: aminopeptidase P N-terminal domain-containing protein, partial [Chitinophagaceae bacterium]